MKKGIVLTTEMLVIVVFLVIGFFIFLLIYSSVTSESPGMVNTFTNRLLDSILGWVS